MRLPKLPLLLVLPLLAPACTSEVDGAEPASSTPAPADPTDELGLRALQLVDSATQVVAEATEHKNVESAAVTLKSLGRELKEIRGLLEEKKVSMDTHPTYAKQWEEAKARLENAISAMTVEAPKVASTLAGGISAFGL